MFLERFLVKSFTNIFRIYFTLNVSILVAIMSRDRLVYVPSFSKKKKHFWKYFHIKIFYNQSIVTLRGEGPINRPNSQTETIERECVI